MDLQLVIFLVVIVIFAVSGYRSGLLMVLSRLISLPVAYGVTLLFTKPFAHWLKSVSSIEGMMVYLIAGMILFVCSAGVLLMLFSLVRRALAQSSPQKSQASSIAGGLLGGIIGVFIGLLAVWFSSTMQTLLQSRQGKAIAAPSQFTQSVNNLAGKTVGTVTRQLSNQDDLSQATAALIANPAENIQRFERINRQGSIQTLFYSNDVRTALVSRNAAAVMRTPAFQKLAAQPDFKALAMDLLGESSEQAIDKLMAIKITSVWAQIDAVKNDPQFQSITQDPEVSAMMRSGNVLQMMNSAKIESLLNIIASVEPPEVFFDPAESSPQRAAEKTPQIYRWVDEQGKVHYSDKKPAEQN